MGKSAQKCRMLAEISCHLDDLHTGILLPEFFHYFKERSFDPSSTRISSNSSFIVSRKTFSRRVYSSCSVCSELYTGTTTEYRHIVFFLSFVSVDTYRLILSFSIPVVNPLLLCTFHRNILLHKTNRCDILIISLQSHLYGGNMTKLKDYIQLHLNILLFSLTSVFPSLRPFIIIKRA